MNHKEINNYICIFIFFLFLIWLVVAYQIWFRNETTNKIYVNNKITCSEINKLLEAETKATSKTLKSKK